MALTLASLLYLFYLIPGTLSRNTKWSKRFRSDFVDFPDTLIQNQWVLTNSCDRCGKCRIHDVVFTSLEIRSTSTGFSTVEQRVTFDQCTKFIKFIDMLYKKLKKMDNNTHIISTHINTKMSVCLFVCLSVHVFLDHFETDWESLCHKLASCSWVCSKTIIFF